MERFAQGTVVHLEIVRDMVLLGGKRSLFLKKLRKKLLQNPMPFACRLKTDHCSLMAASAMRTCPEQAFRLRHQSPKLFT